ncbi:MAG: PIN domain-containing protein [Planctomycetes bacterium]|nr:PIN domain-containing protein [Planctomycetota bacterium]
MNLLLDVNVLVAAHRADHPAHARALALVDGEAGGGFAWCPHVRNGFLRLVTHAQVFADPTPLAVAMATLAGWRRRPATVELGETDGTWDIFSRLCHQHQARGNAVYDLHLAALAIGHGATLISSDQGFARIAGLRWRPV